MIARNALHPNGGYTCLETEKGAAAIHEETDTVQGKHGEIVVQVVRRLLVEKLAVY